MQQNAAHVLHAIEEMMSLEVRMSVQRALDALASGRPVTIKQRIVRGVREGGVPTRHLGHVAVWRPEKDTSRGIIDLGREQEAELHTDDDVAALMARGVEITHFVHHVDITIVASDAIALWRVIYRCELAFGLTHRDPHGDAAEKQAIQWCTSHRRADGGPVMEHDVSVRRRSVRLSDETRTVVRCLREHAIHDGTLDVETVLDNTGLSPERLNAAAEAALIHVEHLAKGNPDPGLLRLTTIGRRIAPHLK